MSRCAYFVLLSTRDYLPGLLVMHKSLVDAGTKYPLVVMVTPAVPQDVRDVVTRRGIEIRDVDPLYPRDGYQPALHDIRFAETWTKIRMFQLVEFGRLVHLDADMLIRQSMDELMEFDLPPRHIAAAHVCACNPRRLPHYPKDWVPENCAHSAVPDPLSPPPAITETSPRPYALLNSGLVVLNPSRAIFEDLRRFLVESPLVREFSFPDQDLLAEYFNGRWKPLSWRFNALKTLRVCHPQEWSDDVVHCVHYILSDKPWKFRPGTGNPEDAVVNKWWWEAYDSLRADMAVSDPEGWKLVEENVAPA